MKKWVSILLVLMLTVGCTSALAMSTDYHDYTCWPIADHDVTLTIGLGLNSSASDWSLETNWFFNWAMEKSGLNFEFETVQASAMSEKKALMFASDELPDALWGFNITPVEMVKYGCDEGQLMPINEYMTKEVMPNLSAWMEAYPEMYKAITALDGSIFSLPFFYKVSRPAGGAIRVFISSAYLKELGKEKPKSLEELTDVLYAFKAAHPDLVPIGAAAGGDFDIRDYFLNALGYLNDGWDYDNDFGMAVTLRNGKLVIPCADPTFYEFLKLMHQYYEDGIIYKDYFLLDNDTVNADLTNNLAMLQEGLTIGDTYEDWIKWEAAYPLTSEWNDEPQWLDAYLFECGGFVVSSGCEHPVELMKFMDFFYSDLGVVWTWNGPCKGHPDAEGWEQAAYYYNDENQFVSVAVENGLYNSGWARGLHLNLPTGICVGVNGSSLNPDLSTETQLCKAAAGLEDTSFAWDVTGSKDNYFRASMEEFVMPYETGEFPFYVYMSSEQASRVSELKTVIGPYVQNQVAEFITGVRSLDEFDQFVSELEGMGIREYEEIYRTASGY